MGYDCLYLYKHTKMSPLGIRTSYRQSICMQLVWREQREVSNDSETHYRPHHAIWSKATLGQVVKQGQTLTCCRCAWLYVQAYVPLIRYPSLTFHTSRNPGRHDSTSRAPGFSANARMGRDADFGQNSTCSDYTQKFQVLEGSQAFCGRCSEMA